MKIIETKIKDLFILEPIIHIDKRGWFMESYNKFSLPKNQFDIDFIQDNHSYTKNKGTLRGLHFQNHPYSQIKLVRCTKGKIFDVAVDLRKSSNTYLNWVGVELSDMNFKMFLIPKGFAHGFLTLADDCEVQYKVDSPYNKESDRSIIFNDSNLKIQWPLENVILSEKDQLAQKLFESDVNFL